MSYAARIMFANTPLLGMFDLCMLYYREMGKSYDGGLSWDRARKEGLPGLRRIDMAVFSP